MIGAIASFIGQWRQHPAQNCCIPLPKVMERDFKVALQSLLPHTAGFSSLAGLTTASPPSLLGTQRGWTRRRIYLGYNDLLWKVSFWTWELFENTKSWIKALTPFCLVHPGINLLANAVFFPRIMVAFSSKVVRSYYLIGLCKGLKILQTYHRHV